MREILSDREIYIFGAGSLSKKLIHQFYEMIHSLNIAGVIDNNPALAGQFFFGMKIYLPTVLQEKDKERIYILIASSFYREISEQLKRMGLEEERHFYHAIRVFEAIKYQGNRVNCVCCGHVFDRFMPHGDPVRLNARCPYCRSLERHRLIWMYLRSILSSDTYRPVNFLHIAPEEVLTRLITEHENINYLSIDINPKKAMIAIDLTNITLDDDSYDIILCSHVLEHIEDDRRAMKELYRVLDKAD